MVTSTPAIGPRFRCLQYFGADRNVTEVRGLLCRKGLEAEAYEALLDRLFEARFDWDCFMIEGVPADGPIPSVLEKRGRVRFLDTRPAVILPVPRTWEELRSTLSRNMKEALRKCTNSLKRDSLTARFNVVTRGPELKNALETLYHLHGARAAAPDGVPHPNVFETAAERGFLAELCERLSTVDGVRAFSLDLGARTVATRLGFSVGRSLYLYYSGYDPAYGKYSVMTSVVADAIRYAIAHGYESVNLSTGLDLSKTRWGPNVVTLRGAVIPSPTSHAPLATSWFLLLREALRARRDELHGIARRHISA
jgi:CelD/BcsL family acetyltransferase involved in cellulose biosynthesis